MLDSDETVKLTQELFEVFGDDAVIIVQEIDSPTDEVQLKASIRGREPLTHDQSFQAARIAIEHHALIKWELGKVSDGPSHPNP